MRVTISRKEQSMKTVSISVAAAALFLAASLAIARPPKDHPTSGTVCGDGNTTSIIHHGDGQTSGTHCGDGNTTSSGKSGGSGGHGGPRSARSTPPAG